MVYKTHPSFISILEINTKRQKNNEVLNVLNIEHVVSFSCYGVLGLCSVKESPDSRNTHWASAPAQDQYSLH